jgi:hypothetical protein
MTLVTAIIVGLACGYFIGLRAKGFLVFVAVWATVLVIQTLWVVPKEDTTDVLYWPFQAGIFIIGVVMVWLGSKVQVRRNRSADAG